MASVLHRLRDDDSELARRVAAGDGQRVRDPRRAPSQRAHALRRHAAAPLRARRRGRRAGRAHPRPRRAARRRRPDELRPWLFRLTRNRAIDEVRRKRWGDEGLDSDHAFTGDRREDPDTVLRRKESIRRLVEDLADLPVRQRTALLARELDDQTPEQVAAQLGVSVMAAQKLASRARENLVRTRDARDAECPDIRVALLDSHERGVRPSEHALRHVKGCDACRAYQRDIRRLTPAAARAQPGIRPAAARGGRVSSSAAAATKTAAGGAPPRRARRDRRDRRAESPTSIRPAIRRRFGCSASATPRAARSREAGRYPEGLDRRHRARALPAGPSTKPRDRQTAAGVTLPCPAGMRYSGLQLPERRWPSWSPDPRRRSRAYRRAPGSRSGHGGLSPPVVITVGINCRLPGSPTARSPPYKSKLRRALLRGERRLGHVCARRATAFEPAAHARSAGRSDYLFARRPRRDPAPQRGRHLGERHLRRRPVDRGLDEDQRSVPVMPSWSRRRSAMPRRCARSRDRCRRAACERLADDPRDLHLRHPDDARDLGLREILGEAQAQDLAVALAEHLDGAVEQDAQLGTLELEVAAADRVGQRHVLARRLVERARAAGARALDRRTGPPRRARRPRPRAPSRSASGRSST